jgi:hypothetical protein
MQQSTVGRILARLIAISPAGATAADIADLIGDGADDALRWMAADRAPHGPLVAVRGRIWRVAGCRNYDAMTGGWAWMAAAMELSRVDVDLRLWLDEVLTGMTSGGRRSRLTRAAMPTAETRTSRMTAEDRAMRINRRIIIGITQ